MPFLAAACTQPSAASRSDRTLYVRSRSKPRKCLPEQVDRSAFAPLSPDGPLLISGRFHSSDKSRVASGRAETWVFIFATSFKLMATSVWLRGRYLHAQF